MFHASTGGVHAATSMIATGRRPAHKEVRMLRRLSRSTTIAVCVIAAMAPGSVPAAAASGPAVMAAIGDSITRAPYNCDALVDCPAQSWSTGTDPKVNSHYRRLLRGNPALSGHNYNDAVSGAQASGLGSQADRAVTQRAEYITLLIGANDACAPSEAEMTPVDTFRGQIDTALAKLKTGVPNARVLVASIPDLKRLWYIGRNSPDAWSRWEILDLCQSMLANPWSTAPEDNARRDRVRQRVIDYNTQLAQACAAYGSNCKYDGNAVFNFPFTLDHVSAYDYFHPSVAGEAAFAAVTFDAGFAW